LTGEKGIHINIITAKNVTTNYNISRALEARNLSTNKPDLLQTTKQIPLARGAF